jgi:hypothetical protein
MKIIPFNTLHDAMKHLWFSKQGVTTRDVPSFSNGVRLTAENAARTAAIEVLEVDTTDRLRINGGIAPKGTLYPIVCRMGPNGEAVTQRFHVFTTLAAGRIEAIEQIHGTKGADAGAVTLHITKEKSGQAPGGGTSMMAGTFNLKGTDNTRQQATLTTDLAALDFSAGESLSGKITGTPTTLANVLVVVWVKYFTNMFEVNYYRSGVDGNDQCCFIANRPYVVSGISFVHKTAETTAGSLNVQVTKDTSTNAPGAGTDMLTNNANAGFNGKASADIVQVGTLAAAAATLALARGDRLGVDFSAAPTEHANVVISVAISNPQAERVEVSYFRRDTDALDEAFFMASREMEVWDGGQLHAVAAGGASVAQLVKDGGTTAPGAGTDLLATTFNLNATANTLQGLAPLTTADKTSAFLLVDGDRLGIDYADAEQSLIGNVATVSLMAR